MRKIWLIIKREYLVRVRKKAFIVMTIVGPLLMAALMIVPTYLANETQELRTIAIEEDGFEFTNQIEDTDFLHFSKIPTEEATLLKNDFSESNYYALLYIERDNLFIQCCSRIICVVLPFFSRLGILGWIRSGDGIQNTNLFL